MRNLFCPGRFILSLFLGYLAVGGARPGLAALTNVNIIDFAFAPSKVKINVNDQVKWTWTGASAHSTTSDGALWDSDVHGTGFTFTNTFTTAGSFPYSCSVHPFMTGSVTVGSTNGTPSTTAPLVVQVNGNGTVTPNLNGQMLLLGKSFTMTAKPNAGALFANWTGSTNTSSPALTFIMQSNLVFQANFIPNPFGQATATFNGLFFDPDAISAQSAGSFSLVLATTGKFTAKGQAGSTRLALKGQFDAAGHATVNVARAMQAPLVITLQLDLASLDQITGTVSDGVRISNLTADRAGFDGRQNIAPQAGQYTMIFPGTSGSSTQPGGDSFATVTVDTAGKIKLAGSLADGTKLTQSAVLSKNGDWPFFVSLYGGQGLILGWLNFLTTATNDVSGDLAWIKPATATAKFYPAGFNLETRAAGFRYHAPAAGGAVLNLANGSLALIGGDLPQAITNRIAIGANNRVTNLSSNRLTLTFKTTTGTFTGRVVDPATAKTISFNGVALPELDLGLGYFLGTAQSGEALLGPP